MNINKSEKPKKIAFLFMIYDFIEKEELWYNFFNNNVDENLYTIYIHCKNKNDVRINSFFSKFLIDKNYPTEWGKYNLVNVQNKLLELALNDEDNYKFMLLSGSHIPLHNFDFIYNFLISNNSSYFSFFNPYVYNLFQERTIYYATLGHKHFKTINNYKNYNLKKWKFGSQWCILNRNHTNFLVINQKILDRIFSDSQFPDEYAYINFLFENKQTNDIINKPTSFVTWRYLTSNPNLKSKPCCFSNNDLTNNILLNLKSSYLFLRKVHSNCAINENIIFSETHNFNLSGKFIKFTKNKEVKDDKKYIDLFMAQCKNNEPVKKPNNESVKKPNNEPVKKPNKEPNKKTNNEPVKKINNEPVKKINKEPVKTQNSKSDKKINNILHKMLKIIKIKTNNT